MSDKELIQELRKMLKVSQEDLEYLESYYYGGIYVYNGGNFDDTFEACVKIGAIDAKVSVLEFLQQWEAKLCDCPRIILAELNTHRVLSCNSASSRAIPFDKMKSDSERYHNAFVLDHSLINTRLPPLRSQLQEYSTCEGFVMPCHFTSASTAGTS